MVVVDNDLELYGTKEIRWYQIAARTAVEQALENEIKRILVVMPTGAGKTVTSGLIFSSERVRKSVGIRDNRPLRLLFIAHNHRLLTQAEREYASAANVEFIPHSAFSQISQDLIEKGWDIACIDEAHHEAMMSIQYHLEKIGDKPIIGLTATPDRADGCVIKFKSIIEPISRQQAVEGGWLAETEINTFVDGNEKSKVPILSDIFENFSDQMGKTIVFVRTKSEVNQVAMHLNSLGKRAVALLNQTPVEVNEILDDFSNTSKYQFIVNCNRIGEGVDCKNVTDVVLGRKFGSYPQINQVIGRASRPDSPCRVWELANPLSGYNLDTTVIVGTPKSHRLFAKKKGQWNISHFNYAQ